MLIPALASGVLLAVLMSLLLDELAPRFFRQMERMLAQETLNLISVIRVMVHCQLPVCGDNNKLLAFAFF